MIEIRRSTGRAVRRLLIGRKFGVAYPPGQASGFLVVRYARTHILRMQEKLTRARRRIAVR